MSHGVIASSLLSIPPPSGGAGVAFVSAGYADYEDGSSRDITLGASPTDGELILASIYTHDGATPDWTSMGYTSITTVTDGGGRHSIAYRVAASESSTLSFSRSGGWAFNDSTGVSVWSGVHADVLDGTPTTLVDYNLNDAPTMTTLTANSVHVGMVLGANSIPALSTGTYTNLGLGGSPARVHGAYRAIASPGATGAVSFGAFVQTYGISVALKAA